MTVVAFLCPHCQSPLRLENRALFIGRTFDCPDCGQPMQIEADGETAVAAHPIAPAKTGSRKRDSTGKPSELAPAEFGIRLRPSSTIWERLTCRPAWIGWGAAVVFAIGLFWFARPTRPTEEFAATLPAGAPPSSGDIEQPSSQPKSQQPAEGAVEVLKPVGEPKRSPQPEPIVEPPVAEARPEPKEDEPANPNPAPPVAVELPKPPPPQVPSDPEPNPERLSADQIAERLRQKVARFDQKKPVPFIKLLDDVLEDLVGVPIVLDVEQVEIEQLQRPITLKLEQTTVGDILDKAIAQANLKRRIVDGQIVLEPKSAPLPPPN